MIVQVAAEPPFERAEIDRANGTALFRLMPGRRVAEFVNLDLLSEVSAGDGIEEATRRLGAPTSTRKTKVESEAVFERSGGRIRVVEAEELSSVDSRRYLRRLLYLEPAVLLVQPLPPSVQKVLSENPQIKKVLLSAGEPPSVAIRVVKGALADVQVVN